jgi:hypothetical protein
VRLLTSQAKGLSVSFHPIIGQMERAAGFTHDDAAESKLNKLDAVLAQTSTSKQDAALFADMLSLPNDGRYLALDLTLSSAEIELYKRSFPRWKRWRCKIQFR